MGVMTDNDWYLMIVVETHIETHIDHMKRLIELLPLQLVVQIVTNNMAKQKIFDIRTLDFFFIFSKSAI